MHAYKLTLAAALSCALLCCTVGTLHAERLFPFAGQATITKTNRTSFLLCPTASTAQGHCYRFFDGKTGPGGGHVSEAALIYAANHIPGGIAESAEDGGLDFEGLITSLRNGSVVRYYFADLAPKLPDHHYEGLLCAGYSPLSARFPSWRYCGYAVDVVLFRTSD